jgi:hypothetical protein
MPGEKTHRVPHRKTTNIRIIPEFRGTSQDLTESTMPYPDRCILFQPLPISQLDPLPQPHPSESAFIAQSANSDQA